MVYNNVTGKKMSFALVFKRESWMFFFTLSRFISFSFFFFLRFLFFFMALNEVNKLVLINTPALSNYFIAQKSVLTVLVLTF